MTDDELKDLVRRGIGMVATNGSVSGVIADEIIEAVMKDRGEYQAVCAAAYQLAGTVGAPVRFLDALGDAANGEIGARVNPDSLLPVDISECNEFGAAK